MLGQSAARLDAQEQGGESGARRATYGEASLGISDSVFASFRSDSRVADGLLYCGCSRYSSRQRKMSSFPAWPSGDAAVDVGVVASGGGW